MTFQASNYKGRNILDLNNNKEQDICPTSTKGEAWLKHFGFSNSICTHIMRLVTNHTPRSKYRLRFFPKESIAYPCGNYSIETRRHILFECPRYNKYWNPRRESLMDILMFLKFNPEAFCFQDSILD